MVTWKIVIRLLIPVRINCRTEQLPNSPWNGKSALSHICCLPKYLDTVQAKRRAAGGYAILSSFGPCPAGRTAVQLNPVSPSQPSRTLPPGVRASRAREMRVDQGPLCFASIWTHVSFCSWIPAKIGAGTLLHIAVPFCDKFSNRGAALLFAGALWVGNKIS